MVFGNLVQADVVLLTLGNVGVRRARRQGDDQRLGELDGVSANAVVLGVQQGQNVPLHLGHQIPAGLLPLRHRFGANQPLAGETETGRRMKNWKLISKGQFGV